MPVAAGTAGSSALDERTTIIAAIASAHLDAPFPKVDGTSTVGTAAEIASGLAPFGVAPAAATIFAREVGQAIRITDYDVHLDTPYGPATIEGDGDTITLFVSGDEVLTRGVDLAQLEQDNLTFTALTA
jgi:hypothetical protein